jgi:MFS family permease
LVPFAGIAFLWFTGVIRDRLGDREDRFFATIFFGSGIIMVVLFFFWGAVLGAIMGTRAWAAVGLADGFVYVFGFALMNEIIGNYALRMAGVYMTAIGTLWTRTGLMPRWLTIVTYILALGFLVAAERIREARFIFPAWVFVVSVYILILNYRRTHDQESNDGPSLKD